MAGTTTLLRFATADWRRVAIYFVAGWALFALVLVIALNDLGCKECELGSVEYFVGLKMLFYLLLYAMDPWVIFSLNVSLNTGLRFTLPLSRAQINRSMLLHGLVVFLCSLPAWGLLAWLLPHYGIALQPWMFVFAALGLLLYQMLCMRVNVFWRAIVPGMYPLLFLPPHEHELFRGFLEAMTTPWPSVLLLALIAAGTPFVLRAPVRSQDRCPQ